MRWFVTGTDTDIGKTAVTACLAQAARTRGTVVAAKPVASGVAPGSVPEDAQRIADAAGHPPKYFAAWEPPLSPHRAALLAGDTLDPAALKSWISSHRAETVLIEGVGGWRVPLQCATREVAAIEVSDLALWTEGAVIVVAANRLGVLNHARLTVDAIRADGLQVAGVVLNQVLSGTDLSAQSNFADLSVLLDVPVVIMPHLDLDSPAERAACGAVLWLELL